MVDGIHITPIDDNRPNQQRELKGSDSSAGGGSGAMSSAAVSPGMGPPAPEPGSESAAHQENPERDSKNRAANADEKDSTFPQERVADIPDQPGMQLSIRVDEELKRPIFEIKDAMSGDVIREIPSEELIELSKKMPDLIKGMLVNNLG